MEENKQIIIHMTDARPLKISTEDWPILANCRISRYDGETRSQSIRDWGMRITVRQHRDSRAIVYGKYEFNTSMIREKDYDFECGELIEPNNEERKSLVDGERWVGKEIIHSIRRVESQLASRVATGGQPDHLGLVKECADDCINDLPALELK